MTMYYPARDGYPSMFEDEAGAGLTSAAVPMPELESANSKSPDRLWPLAQVYGYLPLAPISGFEIRL
jgi:hypothetical protein